MSAIQTTLLCWMLAHISLSLSILFPSLFFSVAIASHIFEFVHVHSSIRTRCKIIIMNEFRKKERGRSETEDIVPPASGSH